VDAACNFVSSKYWQYASSNVYSDLKSSSIHKRRVLSSSIFFWLEFRAVHTNRFDNLRAQLLCLIEWFARYIKSVPNHFRDARCFKNTYMLKCSEQMYIILNISYFPKQLPCNTWNMNPYLTISQSAKFPKKRKGRNSISR
jgi:hypothetical protein